MKLINLSRLMLLAIALCTDLSIQANGHKAVVTIDIERSYESTEPTVCQLQTSLVRILFGYSSDKEAAAALKSGKLTLCSVYDNGSRVNYVATQTIGGEGRLGHWFTATGIPTSKEKNYCISVELKDFSFLVGHGVKAENDGTYHVGEAFICPSTNDTLEYKINIHLGNAESVKTTQPDGLTLRPDMTSSWLVKPFVACNDQPAKPQNYIQVREGEKVTLSATLPDDGSSARYSWLDRKGKTLQGLKTTSEYVIENAQPSHSGMYTLRARVSTADGKVVICNCNYYVDVQTNLGEFFDWRSNTPTFGYNFRDEYPTLAMPTKMHNIKKKNGKPANCYEGEWWSCFWGDDLNKEVGQDEETVYKAAKNMVERFDKDFAYIRDYMGWPPDLSGRDGYKSYIYIFGSGLQFDNTPNTEKGGYQGSYFVDGKNYACVTASYYPFSRFRDDADKLWSDGEYQRGAMIHEGIHAIFADLNHCQGSSWFHEAGNTWLQSAMEQHRSGQYGVPGFLDCCPFIAPHQPIECYSGWLQDGSYGGPQAQGVNMYNSSGQQVCTWRNLLGGTQYANSFPIILAEMCGDASIPWIWRYCDFRVLEGIGKHIGEEQMRSLILQYRARMALFDFGGWSKGYRTITDQNMGVVVKPEWEPYWINVAPTKLTCYARPTLNDTEGWLAPDTLTNPGWSGCNIIPIHTTGNRVTVEFRPEDTELRAQLCYRTADGECYYSQPAHCGPLTIDTSKGPANGIVFCVVANTDYIYTGDAQRKHHYDYRIRLDEGALAVADPYLRWYFYERDIKDQAFIDAIHTVTADTPSVARKSTGIYTLQGQELASPQPGINIIDGKKVLVK